MLRWSYDANADALYVVLTEQAIDRQHELEDGTILDVAADGSVVGIEVLCPRAGVDVRALSAAGVPDQELNIFVWEQLRELRPFDFADAPAVEPKFELVLTH